MSSDKFLFSHPKNADMKWVGPYYYNHPDGEDLIGKLGYTIQVAFWFSTPVGVVNANKYPRTDTKGKLLRYARINVPAMAMAAAFTCATYFSTRLRGKDDEWNYVIGGAVGGSLLGPALNSVKYSFVGALVCALAGFVKKNCHMKGKYVIEPPERELWSSYYLRFFDTSLKPHIRGNWTRDPPPN